MNTEKELYKIEGELNKNMFGYGVGEILLGLLAFFIWCFNMDLSLLKNPLFWAIYCMLLFVGKFVNKKVVVPRIGHIKHKQFNVRPLLRTFIVGVVAGFIVVSTAFLLKHTALYPILHAYPFLFSAILLTPFLLMMLRAANMKQFYIYVILYGITRAAKQFIELDLHTFYLVAAIALLSIGGYRFIRFLKKHPVQESDDTRDYETISR